MGETKTVCATSDMIIRDPYAMTTPVNQHRKAHCEGIFEKSFCHPLEWFRRPSNIQANCERGKKKPKQTFGWSSQLRFWFYVTASSWLTEPLGLADWTAQSTFAQNLLSHNPIIHFRALSISFLCQFYVLQTKGTARAGKNFFFFFQAVHLRFGQLIRIGPDSRTMVCGNASVLISFSFYKCCVVMNHLNESSHEIFFFLDDWHWHTIYTTLNDFSGRAKSQLDRCLCLHKGFTMIN